MPPLIARDANSISHTVLMQKLIHKGKSIDVESEEQLTSCKIKNGSKVLLLYKMQSHDPETEKVISFP